MKHLIKALKSVIAKIYHGSPEKFEKFELSRQGKDYGIGIYFTEDFKEAKNYADSDEDGYVYEVKLNVSKPYNPFSVQHARQIAKDLGLDWGKVKNNKLWEDPSTGYTAEDKDNYYIKLADIMNERAESEGRRWWEGEKKLGEYIYKQWDSIRDPKKNWWVVQDPNKIEILKTTAI